MAEFTAEFRDNHSCLSVYKASATKTEITISDNVDVSSLECIALDHTELGLLLDVLNAIYQSQK